MFAINTYLPPQQVPTIELAELLTVLADPEVYRSKLSDLTRQVEVVKKAVAEANELFEKVNSAQKELDLRKTEITRLDDKAKSERSLLESSIVEHNRRKLSADDAEARAKEKLAELDQAKRSLRIELDKLGL
jgi:hypothetical protein